MAPCGASASGGRGEIRAGERPAATWKAGAVSREADRAHDQNGPEYRFQCVRPAMQPILPRVTSIACHRRSRPSSVKGRSIIRSRSRSGPKDTMETRRLLLVRPAASGSYRAICGHKGAYTKVQSASSEYMEDDRDRDHALVNKSGIKSGGFQPISLSD